MYLMFELLNKLHLLKMNIYRIYQYDDRVKNNNINDLNNNHMHIIFISHEKSQ